jgi:hypothetical protein
MKKVVTAKVTVLVDHNDEKPENCSPECSFLRGKQTQYACILFNEKLKIKFGEIKRCSDCKKSEVKG